MARNITNMISLIMMLPFVFGVFGYCLPSGSFGSYVLAFTGLLLMLIVVTISFRYRQELDVDVGKAISPKENKSNNQEERVGSINYQKVG